MSRKAKQADLRRRMAEARSKLLQSQHPLQDDEKDEGSDEVVGSSANSTAVGTRKRPLSPTAGGGGSGGILRKSKYTTSKTIDSAVTQSRSNHQNCNTSLGALMDGYGNSSSDDDDDNKNINNAMAATVTISTDPHPKQTTKEDESKHHYKPNEGILSKPSSILSKPSAPAKDDDPVSDEVWDEFNAMLEADEAANNDATTTTTKRDDEKLISTKSQEDDKDTLLVNETTTSPTSQNTQTKLNDDDDDEKPSKDDLYDNDDTNTMEQTSYEARLARLILLKNKKKKKQTGERTNEDALVSMNLPSAGEFYDPSLAWAAEDDEEEEDGGKIEKKQISSSGIDRDDDKDGTTSSKHTTTMSVPSSSSSSATAAASMAKILRSRRDEARMLASRGEDFASEGDLSGDMDISDGKWF